MARPFQYHVWHLAAFNALPPFASTTINVPRLSGSGTETKTVYSLKKDMEQLRADGVSKGIVDGSLVSIGTSEEGRELWALKVGTGTNHKVLFTGCHHSREWIAVEIPYLVAEYLIQNFVDPPTNEKEKRIKHLLANRQIWFVPMVNPDGHVFTTVTNRNWRPNRHAYNLPAQTIATTKLGGGGRTIHHPAGVFTGVDINRNYPTSEWGQETFLGPFVETSQDPRDSGENSVWCGPSPSSEAETTASANLVRAQQFRANITYHNFSQLLLFPDKARTDTFIQEVGKGMRDLIAERGNPYLYESGSTLYAVTGAQDDFALETMPGRPTYTPELRPPDPPPNPSFVFSGLPESQIEPCFKENLAAALALINCAGFIAPATNTNCNAQMTSPSVICQAVRNCWEVFRGWVP